MNNEGLSNERRENTPVERELDPWLHKRLEERARPLNSRILTVNKPDLIPTRYQEVSNITGKSNRMVDSIVERIRLTSGRIGRTVTIGASNLYRMLNLPWFRPARGGKREPAGDSVSIIHQEMPGYSAGDLNDNMILPVTESVADNQPRSPEKTPETYINHIVSSPVTRKTVMNINNQERDIALNKKSSLRISQIAEPHNIIIAGRNSRDISLTSRSVDSPVIAQEVIRDRLGVQQDNSIVKTAGYPELHREDGGKRQVTATAKDTNKVETTAYSSSLGEDRGLGKTTATGKDVTKAGTVDDLSLRREETGKGQITAAGKEATIAGTVDDLSLRREGRGKEQITATDINMKKVVTIDHSSPREEGRGEGQIPSAGINVTTPDISSTNQVDKGHTVYPAKNLVYEPHSSIIRKIVRSLPFVRNIQRKEIVPGESVIQPAGKRQTEQNPNYGHMDYPENMSQYAERPEVTPVNADLAPVSTDMNRITAKDSTIDQKFMDTGYKSKAFASQTLNTPVISRETSTKADAGRAYPGKDLFYRKPLPLAQRLIQSLPLVKNIQSKPGLPGVPVIRSADQGQSELRDEVRSPENLETVDRYMIDARAYNTTQEPPLVSRTLAFTQGESHRNRIFPGDRSAVTPDFIMPVDNSLDLTLAPVSRTSAIQSQEEYPRMVQPTAGSSIARATQKVWRTETQQAETADETQQTETSGETQQTETSGPATSGTQESGTSANENMPDYRTIARETYPFIRRMIMVERERRPSR